MTPSIGSAMREIQESGVGLEVLVEEVLVVGAVLVVEVLVGEFVLV